MKVVHLSSVHSPSDTRIFIRECRALAQAGYSITYIVSSDQPPQTVDGVNIVPVPKPSGRAQRMTETVWRVYQAARQQKADIYHFHDPELIPIGILLKLQGAKVIYDVHEDVPKDILSKPWLPTALRPILSKMAMLAWAISARLFTIVAATPSIASGFPGRAILVRNFPPLEEMNLLEDREYSQRSNTVAYIGDITRVRGIAEMIGAVGLLTPSLNAKLILGGRFSPPELETGMRQLPGWDRVDFKGWMDRQRVHRTLSEARVALLLFHPVPNHLEAQPNKLFEYMAAGLPMVVSDFPLWRELVGKVGCGLLVDPLDMKAVTGAIQWLLDNPEQAELIGKKGQQAVREEYNWDVDKPRLLELYQGLQQ